MLHFIWVFTVCKSTHYGGSRIQRVYNNTVYMCFGDNVDPDQLAPDEAISSGSTGSESMPIFEIPEQN